MNAAAVVPEASNPAVGLEEERLKHISGMNDFDMFHERHRIFPALFDDRNHKRVVDVAAQNKKRIL